jgi:hypothetical protein
MLAGCPEILTETDNDLAEGKCDASSGGVHDSCFSAAEAALAASTAGSTAIRDAALAQAGQHEE